MKKSYIEEITPIKNGMNKEQAQEAIKTFLKDILCKENIILNRDFEKPEDISPQADRSSTLKDESTYVQGLGDGMESYIEEDTSIEAMMNLLKNIQREDGIIVTHDFDYPVDVTLTQGRDYQLTILKDGSKYVQGSGDGMERLIGSYYLDKTLQKTETSDTFKAVPTKFYSPKIEFAVRIEQHHKLKNMLVIKSKDILSFSEYVGDVNAILSLGDKEKITENTGYDDFEYNTNCRLVEESINIIDTEYLSFEGQGNISEETEKELLGLEFTYSLTEFIDFNSFL